ncbi:unnamed protein product [Urochloa humidicola]
MAGDKEQQHEAPALHVVVFPWLAFGHLIPFLELSKRLAARGHSVTFISTPRNIARLPPVPATGLSGHVRMVALPLPAVDGLPEGAESTADLSPEKVELLKVAFDGLAAPFAEFLAAACAGGGEEQAGPFAARPDWVVLDFAHYWLGPIADQHKVPCAMFVIYTATWIAYCGSRQENIKHPRVTVEDLMPMPRWFPTAAAPPSLAFRRHEAAWLAAAAEPNASGVSDFERYGRAEERCRLLMVRSCPEAEPHVSPLLADLLLKPVLPAGLLLPAALNDRHDGDGHGALRWLDAQPPRSVVYVALGSEAPITAEGVGELAAGLELSGVRFLWALRRPAGHSGELLPDGFEQRVAGRGVVITDWVPQVRVLAHGAVGAFLTHCGWGSTIEGLFGFGHPLVMLPFITDQGLIARIVARRGAGVEVARREEEDGWFGRDDVAAAVRRVMGGEEGKVFALNARRMREEVVVDDGHRLEQYVDELVECLRRHS